MYHHILNENNNFQKILFLGYGESGTLQPVCESPKRYCYSQEKKQIVI